MNSDNATIWRHKKRGTTYEIVTETASLQCSSHQDFEDYFHDDDFVVYRNTKTGAYYVRPHEEFFDGRFEMIEESAE